MRLTPRRTNGGWLAVGLFLLMAYSVRCHQAAQHTQSALGAGVERPMIAGDARLADLDANERFARNDPLGFLVDCYRRYQRDVEDYRCTFVRQERIDGRLLPQQTTEVRFRESPFSVDMMFVENVTNCKRALYVEGMWQDGDGNPQLLAKPGGALIRALVPRVKQSVNGALARRASRRPIDKFGFGKALELILQYARRAEEAGELEMKYLGRGTIDGRETYVLERRLPYDGEGGTYPDRLLVIHIDREYLLPTACLSYADDEGRELLGSYIYSDIVLNVGYAQDDFDPDSIGF